MQVLIRPNSAETYHGYRKKEVVIAQASAEVGEQLYTQLGCIACHTTDGSRNHGPSFKGLADSKRTLAGGGSATADDAYLRESIVNPTARTVDGYPEAMMPPYPVGDKRIDSLLLYIRGLK